VRDIKGANGFVVARVDASGLVTLGPEAGPIAGLVNNAGEIFADEAGAQHLGRVDGEGTVFDLQRDAIGKVDTWGRVYDRSGSLVGNVEKACDAGVLMLIAQPVESTSAQIGPDDRGALMAEALELGEAQRFPKVRKDYKPLSDRDLFMEHLNKESGQ
jgi:hypothetical protein